MVRVEVPRVVYAKELPPGAPMRGKRVEVPAMMGEASDNMSPRTNGGRVNGSLPQLEDVHSWAALTHGT
jgi:hypothetical protein